MAQTSKLGGGAARFHQADYVFGRYGAKVPTGTTLADVMHPEYFQNHLSSLRPAMMINVVSDDMALDCDLRVETVTKTTARLRVLRAYEAKKAPKVEFDTSEISVGWAGPQHKWRVVHAGEVVSKGHGTEDEAKEAAAKYEQQIKG